MGGFARWRCDPQRFRARSDVIDERDQIDRNGLEIQVICDELDKWRDLAGCGSRFDGTRFEACSARCPARKWESRTDGEEDLGCRDNTL